MENDDDGRAHGNIKHETAPALQSQISCALRKSGAAGGCCCFYAYWGSLASAALPWRIHPIKFYAPAK
jgi:hypothetical protein